MARLTRTLAQLRTAAKEDAGMENSAHSSDGEIDRRINQSIEAVYDIATVQGDAYAFFGLSTTLSGSTSVLTLPSDFYELQNLLFLDTRITEVMPIENSERAYARDHDGPHAFTLEYVPTFTRLSADGDTFTFIPPWDDFVTCDVAARMREKEQSDTKELLKRRDAAHGRLLAHANKTDPTHPPVVQDVRFRRSQGLPLTTFLQTDVRYRLEGNSIRIFRFGYSG